MKNFRVHILLLSCLLLLGSQPAPAQITGDLFTVPAQRDWLNYLREEVMRRNKNQGFNVSELSFQQVPDDQTEEAADYYSLEGIMTRRNGSYSIWLNGRSLDENELPGFIRVSSESGRLSLLISNEQGTVYRLKPGQTLELNSGSIIEQIGQPEITEAAPLIPDEPLSPEDENAAPEPVLQENPDTIPENILEQLSKIQEVMEQAGDTQSQARAIQQLLDDTEAQ